MFILEIHTSNWTSPRDLLRIYHGSHAHVTCHFVGIPHTGAHTVILSDAPSRVQTEVLRKFSGAET
jgi:hypothetical protein